MELSMRKCISIFIMFPVLCFSSSSLSTCTSRIKPFLNELHLQCPTSIMYSWPIEMNAESLDKALSSSERNRYVAILFYASSCPFSMNVRPKFDALSSMFPQIKHVMVEQSSIPPIVFSRHGIHGVPSIIIVNRTTRVRHNGPKDSHSLVNFYHKTTGLEPVINLTEDQIISPEYKPKLLKSHNKLKNINSDPYLIFSLLFISLKSLLYLYPNMVSSLIALWLAYIPHLNLSIFGESRQILGRVLHVVDFQRVFGKLKISRSAREWTPSFASFSLGKTATRGRKM